VETWRNIDIPAMQDRIKHLRHPHLASTQIVWFATKAYRLILIHNRRHGKYLLLIYVKLQNQIVGVAGSNLINSKIYFDLGPISYK
jgi:hypothetical protein